MRTRIGFGLAILGGLLVLAAGCGRGTGPTARNPAGGSVKLTLFTWTPPPELAANQQLLRDFTKVHPNLEVNIINEPGERAMDKLQAMVAAGKPPDVMSIHGAFFVPFASRGALADFGQFIGKDKDFDLPDFYPRLVNLCQFEKKQYSLPRYTSVYVLFYNKDLFDAAGVSYPDESWTWSKYLDAAKKLTKPSPDPTQRRYGCVIDFWGARVDPWIWSNGGEILDATGKRCLIDAPAAQEALQFVVDLRQKWNVTPATTQAGRRENRAMFTSGKAAMILTGAWDIQAIREAKTLRWDIAPLPKQKLRATILGTENYAISAASKHPQEAWELFKFLLGKEAQAKMGTTLEKQPSRQSVANGPYLGQKVEYHRKVFVDALGYAKQPPNIPRWDRVSGYLQNQLDLMWTGSVSVKDGTSRAAKQITAELAR